MTDHSNLIVLASRTASVERVATARNRETVIRERIARVCQNQLAAQLGMEKTKMHRIVKGERGVYLTEIEGFLQALGMGIVECDPDDEIVSLPSKELSALRVLAKKELERSL